MTIGPSTLVGPIACSVLALAACSAEPGPETDALTPGIEAERVELELSLPGGDQLVARGGTLTMDEASDTLVLEGDAAVTVRGGATPFRASARRMTVGAASQTLHLEGGVRARLPLPAVAGDAGALR